MTLVSIAMPVRHAADTLARALASIATQTHAEHEVLLVLNGSDEATRGVAQKAAARDGRIRLLTPRVSNLAMALNVALREARGEFVARMDADDECVPERLRIQIDAMRARPRLAALGSAWECLRPQGQGSDTIRPPIDEREARWRLLLSNPFAHGSMMLRRREVLDAGGYDERLERAQDYDLWLRLSGRVMGVGAVNDVLYRHSLRQDDSYSSCPVQACVTASLLARAWAALPERDDVEPEIALATALGQSGGTEQARVMLEQAMTSRGPSRALLTAWMWTRACVPGSSRRIVELCRGARIREVCREVAQQGVGSIWVYGAGSHTPGVLAALGDAGLTLAGLVDDALAGTTRHGVRVESPASIPDDACVLLSSIAHEEALWNAAAPLRQRGVRVLRIYATAEIAGSLTL